MANTVMIGDIGEVNAIAQFTKAGFIVSKPVANNARYDLIVDDGNKLYRIQVKTTQSIKDGKMIFATKTTNYSKGSWVSTAYSSDDVDGFYLYCVDTDWSGLFFLEDNQVA